ELALAHMTSGGLTVTPLADPAGTVGLVANWAQSPVIVSNGRTAVVVRTGWYSGSPDASGIRARTAEDGGARLTVASMQDGQYVWRKVGDESWADGPGRMKLSVPTSQSPSGWVMEVKPGDDASKARTMYLDMPGGAERVAPVRMIPWHG